MAYHWPLEAGIIIGEQKANFKAGYGQQGFLNLQEMDDHLAKMLSAGWEILTQTANCGERRVLRPFSKRDTITVSFRRK